MKQLYILIVLMLSVFGLHVAYPEDADLSDRSLKKMSCSETCDAIRSRCNDDQRVEIGKCVERFQKCTIACQELVKLDLHRGTNGVPKSE